MPRPRRVVLPSVPLHIIQRGNNRIPCFASRSDYLVYLDMLRECAFDCGCALHAYVLMTNHVHLLLSPSEDDSASMMMQRLGRRYVRYFNRRHARTGTLWEGRMADAPSDYPWSSHLANAFGQQNILLTPHSLYTRLGGDPLTRQSAYRDLFSEALSDEALDQVRQAGKGNRPLGGGPPDRLI
jgi:putative transposase